MKAYLRFIYMSNLVVIVVTYIIMLILFLARIDSWWLVVTFYISIIFLLTTLLLSGALSILAAFHCEYFDDEIKLFWWRWNYKKIPYNKVQCVTIAKAVYGQYALPVCDKEKKIFAIISLYATTSYGRNLYPKQGCFIWSIEENKLCRSIWDLKDLKMILEKTDVQIHMTEEMFWRYKEEVWDLFQEYSNRIIVSFTSDNYDGRKRISFDDILKLQ